MMMQQARNKRYKRKKNFIKKGIQLSEKCGVEVIILIYDRKLNKLNEFCTTPDFKLTDANQIIQKEQFDELKRRVHSQTIHSKLESNDKIDTDIDISDNTKV